MLLKKENACLLLIDVQEKLTPHVRQPEALVAHCYWLMKLAKRLDVPILISEQYPRGLSKTMAPLNEFLMDNNLIEKVCFSCYHEPSFKMKWDENNFKQAVLIGIETHVCVLQTAMELMRSGVEVFVVSDAVSSRYETDHAVGLERMKEAGIQLVTREMVFFEWVRRAGTPEFKALSQEFLKE